MKTLLLLLPLLRPLMSSQRRLCQRSLRASQVLHQQCPQGQVPQQCPHSQNPQSPHGQFLMLLLFLQSPRLLRQSLQLVRPNPQHQCISLRAKGLPASPLPQVSQLVLSCTKFFSWPLTAQDKGHCWTRSTPKSSKEASRFPSAV